MRKIFSVFFALLILTTNVGATFATHFCGGKAVKTAFSFGKNISCGMSEMDKSCENNSQSSTLTRKNCCENQCVQLKTDNNFNTSTILKSNVDFNFFFSFVYTHINLYSFDASTEANYKDYSPPHLNRDIPVLIQSFLI